MKTLFALLLVSFCFTAIHCSFTPDWQTTFQINGWQTKNITLDSAPVAGQNSTFHLCGKNNAFYIIPFESIHVTSGTVIDETIQARVYVNWQQYHCFDVNVVIPEGVSKTLVINFDLHAKIFISAGCVDVTLAL